MSDTPPTPAPVSEVTVYENAALTFVRAHAVAATATAVGTVVGFLVGLLF